MASLLNASQVRGEFFKALAANPFTRYIPDLAIITKASVEKALYGFLQEVPKPRRAEGSTAITKLIEDRIELRSHRWESAIGLDADTVYYDQTGDWRRKVAEMASAFGYLQWEELVALWTGNGTGYDGTTFFATDHDWGESGVQKNALTNTEVPDLNVATATAPTPEEASIALLGVTTYMQRFVDGAGRAMNRGAKKFLVVAPYNLAPALENAIYANNLAQGQTSIIARKREAGRIDIDIIMEPTLATSDSAKFYVFNTDNISRKPFIINEARALRLTNLGEGSEYVALEDEQVVKAKWNGGFALGEPMTAVEATFS